MDQRICEAPNCEKPERLALRVNRMPNRDMKIEVWPDTVGAPRLPPRTAGYCKQHGVEVYASLLNVLTEDDT